MIVVGLTGGIGTGKSTVARLLAEAGVPVVDADVMSRLVVEPGRPALASIVETFGPEVLDASGALDRAAMRHRISHDPQARAQLEAITHPAIREAILERIAEHGKVGAPHVVVEAALMVETGSYRMYRFVIVVTCSPQVQLARVVARDAVNPDDARALMASQMPMADKVAVATHVIENDGDLEDLRKRTAEVWQEILSEK